MAAENYKGKTIKFYWVLEPNGLSNNVRAAVGLGKAIEAPKMILLYVGDNGAYYLSDKTEITMDAILEFIQSPGARHQIE